MSTAEFSSPRNEPLDSHRTTIDAMHAAHLYGSVIIPAHNEAKVIQRALIPLATMTASGQLEVIVAANGCTDGTAELARSVPGVIVLEIAKASKTSALNKADSVATRWPRLYLDADITITPEAVVDVLQALDQGSILAARPAAVYSYAESSLIVRSYFRARSRIEHAHAHLWGCGAYALSQKGRGRFQEFPDVTGDDLYVDIQFMPREKAVIHTRPVTVHAPRKLGDLRAVLRRTYRGNHELTKLGNVARQQYTTVSTLRQLVRSVRSPSSLFDACVYSLVVTAARAGLPRSSPSWERDNSSRVA